MQFQRAAILSTILTVNGIVRLSLMGVGMDSTSMPEAAASRALAGVKKKDVPRKAKSKPNREPSRLLVLFNGEEVLPYFLPSRDAKPSPKVRVAMAAYPIGGGKNISENVIPNA